MQDLRHNHLTNYGVGRIHSAWHKRSLGVHPRKPEMPYCVVQFDTDVAERPSYDPLHEPYEHKEDIFAKPERDLELGKAPRS